MAGNNIHWLAGDRYCCLRRKNEIVIRLLEEGYNEKRIPEFEDHNKLAEYLFTPNLFGDDKNIYIYDYNKIDKDVISVLSKIGEDILIIITPTVNKTTVLYKTFKSHLEHFEPLEVFWGPPSKKDLTNAVERLRWVSGWEGTQDLLTKIFRACNYDYGCADSEIKKIRLYNSDKTDKQIKIDDVKPIIATYSRSDITDLIKAIGKEDNKKVFMILSRMFHLGDLEKNFMIFVSTLLHHFYLILHCRLAIESGVRDPYRIGKFASENWIKNDKPVNPNGVYLQYKEHYRIIENYTSELALEKIGIIEKSLKDLILSKMDRKYIIKDMIYKVIK